MTSRYPDNIITAAQKSHAEFFPKGPYASVSLAQWGVESAYGRSMSGLNNPFGIKATIAQVAMGRYTSRATKEFYHGVEHAVVQNFANYDSVDEAFEAHARLLATSPIYAEAQAAANVEEYVRAMAKHYATAPNYASVLLSIIERDGLKQYDVAAGA